MDFEFKPPSFYKFISMQSFVQAASVLTSPPWRNYASLLTPLRNDSPRQENEHPDVTTRCCDADLNDFCGCRSLSTSSCGAPLQAPAQQGFSNLEKLMARSSHSSEMARHVSKENIRIRWPKIYHGFPISLCLSWFFGISSACHGFRRAPQSTPRAPQNSPEHPQSTPELPRAPQNTPEHPQPQNTPELPRTPQSSPQSFPRGPGR